MYNKSYTWFQGFWSCLIRASFFAEQKEEEERKDGMKEVETKERGKGREGERAMYNKKGN